GDPFEHAFGAGKMPSTGRTRPPGSTPAESPDAANPSAPSQLQCYEMGMIFSTSSTSRDSLLFRLRPHGMSHERLPERPDRARHAMACADDGLERVDDPIAIRFRD